MRPAPGGVGEDCLPDFLGLELGGELDLLGQDELETSTLEAAFKEQIAQPASEGQALELAMEAMWAATPQAAGLSGCSMRSQILCLAAYLDPDTATRAAYLTAALSHACHYHPYELAPTAAELTGWLDQAAQTVTLMQAASAASASRG